MKRLLMMVLVLMLALPVSLAEWVVEEDGNDTFPDALAQANYLMRGMSLEEKIGQLFIVSPETLTNEEYTLSLADAEVFSVYPVGGIVFFGQNIASESQFKGLIQAFRDAADAQGMQPLFLAMNQEGGAVSAIESKLGYDLLPSAAQIGETGDTAQATAIGRAIAERMREFGLNLDFAPAADVAVDGGELMGERSFGTEPGAVSTLALALADGLRSNGITPCFKHFPGQGAAIGAMENGRERSNRTAGEMRQTEWRPFIAAIAAQAEMIQMSSITARGIDAACSATLSSAVIQGILRDELGFTGVIATASLRSPAVTNAYDAGEAAVLALQAGADVLLLPEDLEAAVLCIHQALRQGDLTEERIDESVARILALKIQAGLIR